jgi:hypothetical protein
MIFKKLMEILKMKKNSLKLEEEIDFKLNSILLQQEIIGN